ncbi:MAG: glutaredoxin [Myxococcota bacterium]
MNPRLSLYMFEGCAYCERVRVALRDLEMPIEERDIRREPAHASTLIEALGNSTVPVLRIDEGGTTRFLPESADIVAHLYAEHDQGRRPPFLATGLPQAIGGVLALVFFVLALIIEGPARAIFLGLAAFVYFARGNVSLLARRR